MIIVGTRLGDFLSLFVRPLLTSFFFFKSHSLDTEWGWRSAPSPAQATTFGGASQETKRSGFEAGTLWPTDTEKEAHHCIVFILSEKKNLERSCRPLPFHPAQPTSVSTLVK